MRTLRISAAGGLALLILYWAGMRRGWAPMSPDAFAVGVGVLLLMLLVWGGAVVRAVWRRSRPRGSAFAELLLVAGLLALGSGGMANWLLGLQGSVVLVEGEKRFLSERGQLDAFEAGPLARGLEMGGMVELVEVGLVPEGDGFLAESRLRYVPGHGQEPTALVLGQKREGRVGSLRFYQGAFGFAPRLVLLREGRTLLDQEVPFRTRNLGRRLLSFEGECEVASEKVRLTGAISLEGLDERMKGHPVLGVELRKEGKLLGRGELLPGHFAELEEGYRIGFAGLKKWSEIDISRKNYPLPIFIGLGMMVLGALLWPLAAWRKW